MLSHFSCNRRLCANLNWLKHLPRASFNSSSVGKPDNTIYLLRATPKKQFANPDIFDMGLTYPPAPRGQKSITKCPKNRAGKLTISDGQQSKPSQAKPNRTETNRAKLMNPSTATGKPYLQSCVRRTAIFRPYSSRSCRVEFLRKSQYESEPGMAKKLFWQEIDIAIRKLSAPVKLDASVVPTSTSTSYTCTYAYHIPYIYIAYIPYIPYRHQTHIPLPGTSSISWPSCV